MAILPILTEPHPVLAKRARAVTEDEFNADLEAFVSNMAETMYAAPGVGLAAPQVGDSRRILVANLKGDIDEDARDEWIAMINPVIVEQSDERIRWDESCLSIPEYDLMVDRAHRIHVQWQDVAGDVQRGWFEEFPAVVVQHEMDHLEGITLLHHSSRMKRSRYLARRKKALRSQG